jgi:arabinose-5-phosphate isomerase|tara:strand:+ start:501 stop:1478 length:978 start_codon:yes stop_codon:yes gene_type:complete
MSNQDLKIIAASILKTEANELLQAADRVSESIVDAAKLIDNHNGKVMICGLGKSGLIAQKIAATFCSVGRKAVFLHAVDALHGDLGIFDAGDPTIVISKSGSTEEILRLIPILKEFESPLIGIVGNMNSSIINDLDIVLDASVDNEADPLGIVPTSSTTLTLSIGDALAGVLMSVKGFNKNDFARFHPSGSLGKRLLLTVENIMQHISNVAVVNTTDKLRKVVIAMTEKPNGAAIVKCKNDGFGLITDGDLRRCLAEGEDIDLLDAERIMTTDPVSISSNSSVDNALKLMEDRRSQISVLPVVSIENGECLGLIRLHDIYQTRLL